MEIIDIGRNLTHSVANALGQLIVGGKFEASSSLPTEAEISTQFSTSRSVTREAVKMLTAKGLIISRPRQGIRVQPFSQWNLFDTSVLKWLMDARPSKRVRQEFAEMCWAIVPDAVALACRHGDSESLEKVSAALQAAEDAVGSPQRWADAQEKLMSAVLQASGNRFFTQFEDFLRVTLRLHSTHILRQPHSTEPHRAIFKALIKGRTQGADTAVRRLMTECFGWSFSAGSDHS